MSDVILKVNTILSPTLKKDLNNTADLVILDITFHNGIDTPATGFLTAGSTFSFVSNTFTKTELIREVFADLYGTPINITKKHIDYLKVKKNITLKFRSEFE